MTSVMMTSTQPPVIPARMAACLRVGDVGLPSAGGRRHAVVDHREKKRFAPPKVAQRH
ncbi:hypothetical protein AB0K12_37400 [Nonomuraea sp. NPDC049419]|uniref:hypothetical protein n=1 Tax=Nonomuraea sp. NPDC049419 TaxID=3155772 RepID=UPI003424970A